VQKGIKGSQADAIPVPGQFLRHLQSKDGPFDGVMENVKADEAGVKVVIWKAIIDIVFQ
jgi:hypothetical protein